MSRSTRNPWLGPGLVHRGDARLIFTGARRRSPSWPARAAQAPHRAVRPVGARQDLDPARRPRAAAARAGYCPVYVRIDYAPGCARRPPSRSSRRSSARRAAAHLDAAGVAAAGESLWEFLHHRDDVLRDAAGKTLTPLLIFDQFEEIFTLAAADDLAANPPATAAPKT